MQYLLLSVRCEQAAGNVPQQADEALHAGQAFPASSARGAKAARRTAGRGRPQHAP